MNATSCRNTCHCYGDCLWPIKWEFLSLLAEGHGLCTDPTPQGLRTSLGLLCPELGVPVTTRVPWPTASCPTCLSSALRTPCMAKGCHPSRHCPANTSPLCARAGRWAALPLALRTREKGAGGGQRDDEDTLGGDPRVRRNRCHHGHHTHAREEFGMVTTCNLPTSAPSILLGGHWSCQPWDEEECWQG